MLSLYICSINKMCQIYSYWKSSISFLGVNFVEESMLLWKIFVIQLLSLRRSRIKWFSLLVRNSLWVQTNFFTAMNSPCVVCVMQKWCNVNSSKMRGEKLDKGQSQPLRIFFVEVKFVAMFEVIEFYQLEGSTKEGKNLILTVCMIKGNPWFFVLMEMINLFKCFRL